MQKITKEEIAKLRYILECYQSNLGALPPDPEEDSEDRQMWDDIDESQLVLNRLQEELDERYVVELKRAPEWGRRSDFDRVRWYYAGYFADTVNPTPSGIISASLELAVIFTTVAAAEVIAAQSNGKVVRYNDAYRYLKGCADAPDPISIQLLSTVDAIMAPTIR